MTSLYRIGAILYLALSLSAAAQGALTITQSSLPYGTIGASYSAQLTSSAGSATVWSLRGSLPPGLSFSTNTGTGTISGTPTAGGESTFIVGASDPSSGDSVTKQFTIGVALIANPSPLPIAPPGMAYSITFTVSYAPGPYSWSGQGLPSGLTLNSSSGVLSGTPAAAAGTFNLTITATGPSASATAMFALTVAPALVITNSSPLPSGMKGVSYSQTIQASGGIAPYTFSALPTPFGQSELPVGLSLSSTGTLAGTPTTDGTSTFTIAVVDSKQNQASSPFTLSIGSPGTPIAITTSSPLPDGMAGVSYSQTVHATGGSGHLTFKAGPSSPFDPGALPPGISMNPNGTLAGTPTTAGKYGFTVMATDADDPQNQTASPFMLTIVPAGQGPTVLDGGVLNAASLSKDADGHGTPVAPGSLVQIYGTYPGATRAHNDTLPLSPASLGGVSVTFDGIPAPMVDVSPTGPFPTVIAQLPSGVSAGQNPRTVNVVVIVNNLASAPKAIPVVQAAPGIFTLTANGQGNAFLIFVDPADGKPKIAAPASANIGYPAAPIPRGYGTGPNDVAFLYATGLGVLTPPLQDGYGGFETPLVRHDAVTPIVMIGDLTAQVLYAGVSGYAGVNQVNLVIPNDAQTGDAVPLLIKTADGNTTSNVVTIAVR